MYLLPHVYNNECRSTILCVKRLLNAVEVSAHGQCSQRRAVPATVVDEHVVERTVFPLLHVKRVKPEWDGTMGRNDRGEE